MNVLAGVLALSMAAISLPLAGRTHTSGSIDGYWQGSATARGGSQVPMTIRITGAGANLHLDLLNGPVAHPDVSSATSASFDGRHLKARYGYIGRGLVATLEGDVLSGTFAPESNNANTHGVATPFKVKRIARPADPQAAQGAPDIRGTWEIATTDSSGVASTWEFRADAPQPGTPVIKTVIQRVDGDTGGLWGVWNGTSYRVSHFTSAGATLFSVTPKPDGTLLVKNLIEATPSRTASARTVATAPFPEYVARRPEDARVHHLAAPTDPKHATTVKDPSVPFAFRFPDLSGKVIANTDPEFRGKVVIVAIGGSWCPNCQDEAPMLVNLYRKFHARGLEVVGLDFEEGDPVTDRSRLEGFIRHYGIPYPMLLAGTTDELQEKVPQGVNLTSWPTSFFLGRDGLVKEVHTGFAGPGNMAGHVALEKETTELVEKLLGDSGAKQTTRR
jgi:thiol-disulfide isomerase/thioredoxin